MQALFYFAQEANCAMSDLKLSPAQLCEVYAIALRRRKQRVPR